MEDDALKSQLTPSIDDKSLSVSEANDSDSEGETDVTMFEFMAGDEKIEPYIRSRNRRKKQSKRLKNIPEPEVQTLRLKINSRERKRMHDLNSALDSLRQVMPYGQGASVRKLSKIATLALARNYILLLSQSLEQMKKVVQQVQTCVPPQPPPTLAPLSLPPPSISSHSAMNLAPSALSNLFMMPPVNAQTLFGSCHSAFLPARSLPF